MKPRIFISSVSREFGSTRDLIAKILQRLGYDPVWQDIFGTEPGDLRQVLRDKIDSCEGLIHLAGHAYGAEPPEPDSEFGRCSYTQFEFLYAEKCPGKKTWLFVPGEDCTRDTPPHLLDLPRDPGHPDPAAWQAERRGLQDVYREQLRGRSGHLRHQPANRDALELAIERLKDEFTELRRGEQLWRGRVLRYFVIGFILLALLGGGIYGIWESQRIGFEEVREGQEVTKARVQARLLEAADLALQQALAAAEQLPVPAERQSARDAAEAEYAATVARAADFAAEFARLAGEASATSVLQEMLRILEDPSGKGGVGPALAYFESQRGDIVQRVRTRQSAERLRNRADLQPALRAAGLYQSQARHEEARAAYLEVLDLEPDWPEAITDYLWFLFDRSVFEELHGSLARAVDLAEEGLVHARHLRGLEDLDRAEDPGRSRRAVSATLDQMGDALLKRGQPGDAEAGLGHYEESLKIDRELRAANPQSAEAARDVSVSLNKLGDYLSRRAQPGDMETALEHYEESLEIARELRAANPKSAKAARDVSVFLNKLGDYLSGRGQPGDMETALEHYGESLEIARELRAANPKSAEAARDVSVSLDRLGAYLSKRGQPSDAETALGHYEESLEINRELRAASPLSVEAARDVSVSLNKLGDYLSGRGQPGDVEAALGHY